MALLRQPQHLTNWPFSNYGVWVSIYWTYCMWVVLCLGKSVLRKELCLRSWNCCGLSERKSTMSSCTGPSVVVWGKREIFKVYLIYLSIVLKGRFILLVFSSCWILLYRKSLHQYWLQLEDRRSHKHLVSAVQSGEPCPRLGRTNPLWWRKG